MAQTKWQKAYGVRRTWANKLERQARAIREGDWDTARRVEIQTTMWMRAKYDELTEDIHDARSLDA